MPSKNILLVEGKDDEHVIYAIRDFYNISKTAFEVQDKQGIERLFQGLEVNIIEGSSAVERIGIVIDADTDLNAQWQRTISVLRKAGYQNVPARPAATGTIVRTNFLPTFGAWIMPDNVITRGMLEDFLAFLVPDSATNQVWAKAVHCTQEIFNEVAEEQRFSNIHISKAKIHAYLAWQKETGRPFGVALTARYFEADKPQCRFFADWLNNLFVI